jgi:hypothetical protein
MLKSIKGVYLNGRIELSEVPVAVHDATPVFVTFLEPDAVDLRTRGIDAAQAAELRARLATFIEDWDSPEMDIYDDYNSAEASSEAR